MTCWIKYLSILTLGFSIIGISACQNNQRTKEVINDTPLEVNKESLAEPLNCPAIFETATHANRSKPDQIWLSFQIKQNANYKEELGDACKGDMKILWQDIKRFEPLIEEHSPHIRYISGLLGNNLKYFPVTEKQIKYFIDNEAIQKSLSSKLKLHDRSTLEGGLKIQEASRSFLTQALQDYLNQEHKPILESYLKDYNLKIGPFLGEKYQFCYKSYNRCEYLVEDSPPEYNNLDFEFIGVALGWWEFENINQVIQDKD